VGSLEPKLARRLIKFIQGGNRYQAGITSCEGSTVKVIVREVYQDGKFAGKPSFPIVRRREVEFRPYTRERLVSPDVEVFSTDDDMDDDPGTRSSGMDLDDEDGMHEVAEDEDADMDFGDDVAIELDEDDDDE
jgi:hypothetical protein